MRGCPCIKFLARVPGGGLRCYRRGVRIGVRFALFGLSWLAFGCSSDSSTDAKSDAATAPDSSSADVTWPDGQSSDAGAADAPSEASSDGATVDPCPSLPIPTTCFGRDVMFRDWNATVSGDGSYFAADAPNRLGFNRVQNRIWIVKFQLEENTYRGQISAYGDSSAGIAWISDDPCDASFAVTNQLVAYGTHGGGPLGFIVVKDDADQQLIENDSNYAQYASTPQLRGGHCYYVAFENVAGFPPTPLTASYFGSAGDDCGASGDGTCYYLAMDFGHRLHDIVSGQLISGNVIPGLTK